MPFSSAFMLWIGGLAAFICGWIDADRWGVRTVMMLWTGCIIVGIVYSNLAAMMGGMRFPGGAGLPMHYAAMAAVVPASSNVRP
jgi:hypothetical protein